MLNKILYILLNILIIPFETAYIILFGVFILPHNFEYITDLSFNLLIFMCGQDYIATLCFQEIILFILFIINILFSISLLIHLKKETNKQVKIIVIIKLLKIYTIIALFSFLMFHVIIRSFTGGSFTLKKEIKNPDINIFSPFNKYVDNSFFEIK